MRLETTIRRSIVLALFSLAAMLVPALVFTQSVERSIDVSVLNREGVPVTDLTAQDFIVRENEISREVLRVSRATDPFTIAVLVDNSTAASQNHVDLRNGLKDFFNAMGDRHEFALIGFGQRPTILVDYTRDVTKLAQGANRLFTESASGAYVLDAIVEGLRGLQKREMGRRTMLVISTQGVEFSNRYHEQVLDDLKDSGATLHVFMIGASNPLRDDNARERSLTLDQGTRMTGGRQEDLLTSSALPARLRELATELKNQLRVVYARPQTLIPPDSVEVEVRRPELKARAAQIPAK